MPGDAFAWDALVASSRNGNLLHRRDYMDYHAERFVDASLLVQRGDTVVAVLPANLQGSCVSSHAGLTYAGLLSSMALRAGATLQVFEQIAAHYRALGVREVIYKPVPHIFHAYPAEEELYALHRLGAQLCRR
ncbi:GNAT family N-acetyltransferase, partial [Xanthomonas perforans]|nr:GNAT family N-acetyltransferase [Xanthomonas perforans]